MARKKREQNSPEPAGSGLLFVSQLIFFSVKRIAKNLYE